MSCVRVFVLIGDLVGSRNLDDERASVQRRLLDLVRELDQLPRGNGGSGFAVTRGDEFEGQVSDSASVLSALWAITGAFGTGVRLGIGLGSLATEWSPNVLENDGPVFHFAREALESIPRRGSVSGVERIAFKSDVADETVMVDGAIALLWNRYRTLTVKQRGLIESIRDGRGQSEIADELGMKRQSVADAVSGAGIDAILRAEQSLLVMLARVMNDAR